MTISKIVARIIFKHILQWFITHERNTVRSNYVTDLTNKNTKKIIISNMIFLMAHYSLYRYIYILEKWRE